MHALLLAGAALWAVLVLLLALPVELRFRLRGLQPFAAEFEVRLLFGLWHRRFALPARRRDAAPPPRRGHDPAPPARVAPDPLGRLQALWHDAPRRRRALHRLRAVLSTLHWRELRLDARLGLEDPADTGRLWALLGPLGAALAGLQTARIALEPDFVEARLDVDARGRLVLVPWQVLWSVVRLAATIGLAMRRTRGRA